MAQYNGSIELIGGLTQKNGGSFALIDASAVQINDNGDRLDQFIQNGSGSTGGNGIRTVANITERDNIDTSSLSYGSLCFVSDIEKTYQWKREGWTEFGTASAPELQYDSAFPEGRKIYYDLNDNINIIFKFTSSQIGNCTVFVYKDNALFKTESSAKGTISVNLGKATTEGTSIYRISVQDYIGISAPNDLYYTIVVGGVTLSTTFDRTLEETIDTTTNLDVIYTVKASDISSQVKVNYILTNNNEDIIVNQNIDTGTNEITGTINFGLLNSGIYTLKMQAFTGETLEDEVDNIKSAMLIYSFSVINEGEIAIITTFSDTGFDTDTSMSIPFKCSAKGVSRLLMRGEIRKLDGSGAVISTISTPSSGVTCTVNVTSSWFIGKLAEGNYEFTLNAFTIDNLKQSTIPATGSFRIEASSYTKVEPIQSNMLMWFDANDMSNAMEHPDVWLNRASTTDAYYIKLHNLNYNTNGWKHVDTSIPDSQNGEMMLKFTGDSYGEIIDANTEEPYCPFSNMVSASSGFTIEVLYRTRCVGVLNSRVATCQFNTDINSPGVSISYDKMYFGSDSQYATMDFAEDSFVHATFVIDSGLRNLTSVGGISNVENINPIPTMRIYINGSLCSVTPITNDRFVDSNNGAYPFYLNASTLLDGAIGNFGECEIKMIRMYNTALKATEVVQNRISSIYDIQEQELANARNNAEVPTLVFKRRKTSQTGSNFRVLNSITDKPTSKKTYVDCVVEYNDGLGNVTVWDYAEIYLQGTSSLQYPVKNYKTKLYTDETKSSKLKVKIRDEWEKESTFTFKCDFSDGSHLNNTPTAGYYSKVMEELGGDSPAILNGGRDAIDGFPVLVYYTDDPDDTSQLVYAGSYMFNLDKTAKTLGFGAEVTDADGNSFVNYNGEVIPNKCQSFEGVANATDTAGCFFKLEDSIQNVYNYYVEDVYNEAYNNYLTSHSLDRESFTYEQYQETQDYANVEVMTFEVFVQEYNEFDYVADDFEPRYDYTEYEDIDDPTPEDKERCYGAIRDMINWVSDSSKNLTTFKSEFEDHFSLKYCIGYYLNMYVFGQVDNAGKNCMWDTWDGQIWMPRPYDMDTQCGLSNTGTETIDPDAELIPALSPTYSEGTYAESSTNSLSELRYASYNTKTSRFWTSFGKAFANDIKASYQQLRSTGIYTIDSIMDWVKSYTVDIIGESYFNKDMAIKYLMQTDSSNTEWLKSLHGNRIQKYQQWIAKRLIFCDTLFDYRYSVNNDDSLNSEIQLRSDMYISSGGGDVGTIKAYLGITVYSPQYVTVNVGSSRDAIITAYVGPNSTYVDPDTNRVAAGTLFTFPIRATDKEVTISGAGNIMEINKIESLNVRDLNISTALKITSLNLSGSSRMTRLNMGNNKYLRTLNCNGSYLLGSVTGGQVLDLTGCPNLQTLDISNTQVGTVNFATGGNLKQAILRYSKVRILSFNSMNFLSTIDIEGCDNLTEYSVNSCQNITNISLAGSPLASFTAIDCNNLLSVDCSDCGALQSFEITGCDSITTLNMQNNTGTMMEDLSLYTLYNLESLNVSNSYRLKNIRFPKYATKAEADRIADAKLASPNATDESLNAVLWTNLASLDISYSGIKSIQYGSNDIVEANRTLDMGQLNSLASISFRGCTSVIRIKNINYTASNMSNLFKDCSELIQIEGSLRCNSNASNIFYNCKKLEDLTGLTVNFNGCTNLASAFAYCTAITYETVADFLNHCDTSLTNISGLLMEKGTCSETTLPDNLFDTTPNITNMNTAFYNNTSIVNINSSVFQNTNEVTTMIAAFSNCTGLRSISSDIMSCFPKVTSTARMFARDTALISGFNTEFFINNTELTSVEEMFYGCTNLTNNGTLSTLLDSLTELTNAKYTFYNCTSLTGSVPDGFFNKNTKLTDITGCFALCSQLSGLPRRLFRMSSSDTTNLNSLTMARSVFYGCTNMSGTVESSFFDGAPNITNIGDSTSDTQPNSTTKYSILGFFGNTKISGYYDDFLQKIPRVTNVYGLFCQDKNINNSALRYCYSYDNEGTAIEKGNTISFNLFGKNTMLTIVNKIFYGCTGISGCIPYLNDSGDIVSMFEGSKNVLRHATSAFSGCTNLNGIDNDYNASNGYGYPVPGIRSELFKNFSNIVNLEGFMTDCRSYTTDLPNGLFDGCTSLQTTTYMFYKNTKLEGTVRANLFNSCRDTLTNVSYMFYDCPELTSIESGSKDDDGNYVQKGLLADIINLTSTAYMFYRCTGLTGVIPIDIFETSVISNKYTRLTTTSNMFHYCTGLDTAYTDSISGIKYLVSPEFLTKCVALTNVSFMFGRLLAMEACNLPPSLFARQVQLIDATGLFYGIRALTGSVTSQFMINCTATLQNVQQMFAFTNLTNIEDSFLHGELKNSVLKNVGALFYKIGAGLRGNVPPFWNGSVFTALNHDETGYFGCVCQCTGLDNYNTAVVDSTNWAADVNIYV